MKECIVEIPLFMTPYNMEYLLNGNKIINYEKLYKDSIKNNKVYISRKNEGIELSPTHDNQYPDNGDIIIGDIVGYNLEDPENPKLRINILNSLYYSKLSDPVIRCNGQCIIKDNEITIVGICRYTLSERSFSHLDFS